MGHSGKKFYEKKQEEHLKEHGVYADTNSKIGEWFDEYVSITHHGNIIVKMKNDFIGFADLLSEYTDSTNFESFWSETLDYLLGMTGEYHNINHVYYMWSKYMSFINDPNQDQIKNELEHYSILLTILYHDVDPNEFESIKIFNAMSHKYDLGSDLVNNVNLGILATTTGINPRSRIGRIVSDLDLSILAEEESIYDEYAKKIRKEYSHVGLEAFRKGRLEILNSFLAQEQIFSYKSELELKARENIKREILTLK